MLQGLSETQAREVLAQVQVAEAEAGEADEDDSEEADDKDEPSLLDDVRAWMAGCGQAEAGEDALHDFNLKVRFQGHLETTAPEHLGALLQVLAAQAWQELGLATPAQPVGIQERARHLVARWACMLGLLYQSCESIVAADMVVSSVTEGVSSVSTGLAESTRDCAVVGLLMAIRDQVEALDDEDLLAACRRRGSSGKAMSSIRSTPTGDAYYGDMGDHSDGANGGP
mmetsp:Transcript_66535/g.184212  ORF Transcript_66535/g.184212 Transcript_66535/m.184212 type:complete len:227 (+) Transcript_66535:255-935(+)